MKKSTKSSGPIVIDAPDLNKIMSQMDAENMDRLTGMAIHAGASQGEIDSIMQSGGSKLDKELALTSLAIRKMGW